MSKVLVSYFSYNGESTYDAVCKTLFDHGNDVFRINTKDHINYTNWAGDCTLANESLLKQVIDFNPDLVLNFSHSLPLEITEKMPSSCAICLIDGDNPLMFWNKNKIKNYMKRYIFLGMQSASKNMYEHIFELELDDKCYMYFPSATALQANKMDVTKNISFIGSAFLPYYVADGTDEYFQEKMFTVYNKIRENFTVTAADLDDDLKKNFINIEHLMQVIKWQIPGQDRIRFLSALSDLGLHIYGLHEWAYVANIDIDLAKCFNRTPVVTLDENAEIYNSSKICINTSHPQAKTAFSWRVMDIMASNSCLLMENKPDWHDLFAQHLSQDVLDAIVYTDRFDIREKAQKLLADEKLRLRCIQECNLAIELNGRWHHRLGKLEVFLSLPLLNIKGHSPQYIQMEASDFINSDETIVPSELSIDATGKVYFTSRLNIKNIWLRLGIKSRCKNMGCLVMLFIAHIPAVGLLIKKENRLKYLDEVVLTLRRK